MTMRWPLMAQNITGSDREVLIEFLATDARLTNGPQVEAFERAFADYLGVKHCVMVNSGASANLITMTALKWRTAWRTVAVPVITWSSDIMAVLHAGLEPVFVDVDPHTLGMDRAAPQLTQADAAFVTHCLGFDAGEMPCPLLIEDCCEAPGATRDGKKLGTFGLASNFSFYYGHQMTTIEGGMVCTNDAQFYAKLKMLRSHGMTRESTEAQAYARAYPDLHPEFIFAHPSYNVRSTELNAVLGLAQLPRLEANNSKRTANLRLFLSLLDADRYRTRYPIEGSANFALPLVLQDKSEGLMERVLVCLNANGVEYRRGTAGGGNQLRQPYLRERYGELHWQFPQAEHIHEYGLYCGNYPTLQQELIADLCERLNKL